MGLVNLKFCFKVYICVFVFVCVRVRVGWGVEEWMGVFVFLGVDMYRGQTVGGVRVGDPTFAPHLSQSLLTTKPG